MELSNEQRYALQILIERIHHNIFLSGFAGTGKTTILRQFIHHLRSAGHNVRVAASTGLAALHLEGITLAKLLGLRLAKSVDDFEQVSLYQARLNMRGVRTLILDEISMLSGDMLELVDYVLQAVMENEKPFGGVRMIFSGDFLQLPPVGTKGVKLKYPWAFEYPEFSQSLVVFLKEPHRQAGDDADFLNELRQGILTPAGKILLGEMSERELPEATFLSPRRDQAAKINSERLKGVSGQLFYIPTECDRPEFRKEAQNQIPVGDQVLLKKDVPVIILTNDPNGQFVNGSQGRVKDVWRKSCRVILAGGKEVMVSLKTWEVFLPGNELVRFTGLPIQLGWAATIHRSQGMTLDAVSTDLDSCWEPGQAYVALSRTKSLKNVSLTKVPREVKVDPVALSYSNHLI